MAKYDKDAIEKYVAEACKNDDYKKARKLGLTQMDRWSMGMDHHPKSVSLMEFLKEHDFCDYGDYFYWKMGGDGDNGETLMYQMDAFFEMIDIENGDGPDED